jgi:hypothetical protein
MRELEVDPKIVADQLGHSVDVNLNVYSKTSLKIRKQALDSMESAVLEDGVFWNTLLKQLLEVIEKAGAGDGDRTRDVQLGKLAFYR